MMALRSLLSVDVFLVLLWMLADARVLQNELNQCPQPTDLNPDPPGFVYAHPNSCSRYFSCSRGRPTPKLCKPPGQTTYSEFYHTCVGLLSFYDTCTRLNAQRECGRGLPGLIGHPTLCHRYYNCSQPAERSTLLGEYEDECPYPMLFDIEARQCVPFKETNCGPNRVIEKNPCDYVKNKCTGPDCIACSVRLPSCKGLDDGLHAFPGKEWTKFYIRCDSERLVEKLSCGKNKQTRTYGYFSPIKRKCVAKKEVHVPVNAGHTQKPSCDGKLLGLYRMSGRPDAYYSCPGEDVFFCDPESVFNEISYQCQETTKNNN